MGPNPPLSESASTTHGHHSGKLYRKQRNLVTNLFDVDVEPHVEDDATAYKLIWHALVCATVAATANSHKYLQRCLQRLE